MLYTLIWIPGKDGLRNHASAIPSCIQDSPYDAKCFGRESFFMPQL